MDSFEKHIEQLNQKVEAREKAEQEADVVRQKEEGHCDLIPFPTVATQPFRSEMSVEGSSIFVVNAYKEDFRHYERTLTHPQSKEPVIQRITVGKLHDKDRPRGALKQTHQEIFYKLLKLWGDRGYPIMEREENGKKLTVGYLTTTVYELVTYLRGNDSAKHYRRVQEALQDLSSIPIVREQIYGWQDIRDRQQFKLLSDVVWNEAKVDSKTRRPRPGGTSEVSVLFSPHVTEGFLTKNVKQLLMGPYNELGTGRYGRRAEVARLLYPILDHELANKDSYHVTLTALSERLGVAPKASKGHRKRPFTYAIQMLNGKPILGEKYQLRVELRPSGDGRDFILVAQRQCQQLELFQDE